MVGSNALVKKMSFWRMGGIGLLLLILNLATIMDAGAQEIPIPSDSVTVDSAASEAPPELKKLMEAIESEQNSDPDEIELEVDGLIMDETVTKAGRDFYQIFYSTWEAPPNSTNFTISISEKPARGIATVLMIDINENRVIETPLQPRYDIIESIAEQAVRICYEYLLNYEQIQEQLEGDDLSGSGIF